jgi:SAM-dependent methyltransferase
MEPSEGFANPRFEYVGPSLSGEFPFPDQTFDLITCLHVLHHLPKISFALKEISRVLAPGGFALVSEPITSMGDWNYPRKGLTKHERGIPITIFRAMINQAGLSIYRETKNCFSLSSRWSYLIRRPPYNQQFIVKLDKFLCRLPWFSGYHATGLRKLRVLGTYFVLTR